MQQGAQLQRLQQQAMGQGPSIASMQGRAALSDGQRQLQAMAASDRRNPALARRNAMIQGGALSARIQGQVQQGRLAEQQAAEQALVNAISNAQAASIQRAKILQGAYDTRYQGAMGTPTNFERGANVLAATLPMIGKLGEGQG
jgi:hypothetical protein